MHYIVNVTFDEFDKLAQRDGFHLTGWVSERIFAQSRQYVVVGLGDTFEIRPSQDVRWEQWVEFDLGKHLEYVVSPDAFEKGVVRRRNHLRREAADLAAAAAQNAARQHDEAIVRAMKDLGELDQRIDEQMVNAMVENIDRQIMGDLRKSPAKIVPGENYPKTIWTVGEAEPKIKKLGQEWEPLGRVIARHPDGSAVSFQVENRTASPASVTLPAGYEFDHDWKKSKAGCASFMPGSTDEEWYKRYKLQRAAEKIREQYGPAPTITLDPPAAQVNTDWIPKSEYTLEPNRWHSFRNLFFSFHLLPQLLKAAWPWVWRILLVGVIATVVVAQIAAVVGTKLSTFHPRPIPSDAQPTIQTVVDSAENGYDPTWRLLTGH